MKKFLTEYIVQNRLYASHIFANSITNAKQLCRERNIGEKIIGLCDETSHIIPVSIEDELHEACFLSFICLNAKLISVEKILGDKGIVHEYIHLISQNDENCSHIELRTELEFLRNSTPGYMPNYSPI